VSPTTLRRAAIIGAGCVAVAVVLAGLVSFGPIFSNPALPRGPAEDDTYDPAEKDFVEPDPTPCPPAAANDPPRLAVLVVFDQLRADYLTRWHDLFEEGGFRRLQNDGAWFQNCHLPYTLTLTAPGHASLATGCSPMKHGIVGNTWYDRGRGAEIYCVYEKDRYELVPLIRGAVEQQVGQWPGISPEQLQSDTLGDALKQATGGKGRVVSLSLKDRSAVLLACRTSPPDASYWFFPSRGMFVTSTYYRPNGQVHPWVAKFNNGRPANAWFGKDWTRLRPDLDYVQQSGPDDVAAEDTGWEQGRTFPHAMTGGLDKPGQSYYEALGNSPFGNELLLDLAKRAITAERLGCHDVPDLLCLSFSSNDTVGHCWGPDSQEVLDMTLRTDRIVKDLLNYLDAKVGRGRYVLALTADHGICPLPELARQQGKDAGHVSTQRLTQEAEAFLNEKFLGKETKGLWIEAESDLRFYLNHNMLREHHLEQAAVEEALATWLASQPGVLKAYTRKQLNRGPLDDDPIGERVRRSFHPQRSGDVVVVLQPYYLVGSPESKGTTHGSPHSYDTHVPLLIYGPGIRAGVRTEPTNPLALATILARSLGIAPPGDAEATEPENLRD
jgi:predicted AlkP superfamily pyrophosphatase or phosphodiesterase